LLTSFFFFQAEDGIRDFHVTGVQTCALPISFNRPRFRGGPTMPNVLVDTVDGVRIITLNRPERHNAVNDEMGEEPAEAWSDAFEDAATIAILVKGAGKSFCSGRDVTVLGHRARDESDFHFVRRHQQSRLRLMDSPKPIVAAVKGAVLGGGCEMALAADVRVSSTDLKMALPEINYGILPDTGGSQMMT